MISSPVFRFFSVFLAGIACAAAQTTVRFPVIQDSWVNSRNTTRNYGSQSTLQIKHENPVRTPYLQFQTYGITGNITSATIKFRFLYDSGTVTAHKANNETWDESIINFGNQPGFATASSGSASVSSGAWASLPVTAAVTGNGFFSFALRSTSINGELYSKDSTSNAFNPSNPTATNIPYLEVVYQPVNQPPVGQADTYTVLHNTLRTITAPGVLANDSDPNGDPITAELVSTTSNGTLNLSANGSFTYQPNTNFAGTDSFIYRALDNTTGQSSNVTVTLNVLAAGVGELTPAELNQIQTELGVTLTIDQQVELATLVKPTAIDAWRTAANARIEANRKANLNITVRNSSGSPVPGATVRARLKRKTFHFGGVLDLPEFMNGISGGITAANYRSAALKYFDSVGLNNALKPKQSLYDTYGNGNLTNLQNTFFPWCAANNVPVRGHLLLWPGGTFMSAPVDAKVVEIEAVIDDGGTPTQTQLDELRALVDNEITTWAGMWNVYEWDVVNEVYNNHRIQDILGPNEIVRWFQLAQTASANAGRPNTGRLINDYQIISADALTNGNTRIASYKSQIQYLIDNNAPITAIGFQSRFKFRREDPALLYSRLEQFAGYNKDMVGTEFEVAPNPTYVNGAFEPTENLRAQMTEEVMTTYFSHPKMTGFFAWEFANSEERALITNAGAPKLNGLVWYYLNRIRYHTDTTLTTNALGQVSLRGFKGDYEIVADTGTGEPVSVSHSLNNDSSIQIEAANTVTMNVIEDSHAQEGSPTATAGSSSTLQLKTPNASNGRVAYLKFDLSQVSGAVDSAKLRLYIPTAGTPENGETNPIEVLAVANSSWTEASLNWNNRPTTGAVLGSGKVTSAPGVLEITLDPASVTPGGIWSVALNETGGSYGTIASSENASSYPIPQLVLNVVGNTTNQAPVFSADPITGAAADVNTVYHGTLAGSATDPDVGDTITYTKVSGPSWLTLSPDGSFYGVPSSANAGLNTFTVSATDGIDSATATFNVTVATSELVFNVVEDTHAQEATPAAFAPNSATLQLKTPNGSNGRVAYLKFNLTPTSGAVQTAKLRLYIPPAGTGTNGETNPIQALAVTDHSWTEAGLNWNNRPATGTVLGTGSIAASNTPGILDIDLNPAALPTAGGAWSLALNETGGSYGTIASSENTSAYPIPQLLITTRLPDSDSDGIPDVHEATLGLNPLLPSDATADADGDGFSNFMEYVLGGSLGARNMVSDYLSVSRPPGNSTVNLTLRRRAGLSGPVVRVGVSPSLGSWTYHLPENLGAAGFTVDQTTITTTTDAIGTIETVTLTLSSPLDRGFFRLQVTP